MIRAPAKKKNTLSNAMPTHHKQCAEQKCTLCNVVFEKYGTCGKDEWERIASETKGQNNQFWLENQNYQ